MAVIMRQMAAISRCANMYRSDNSPEDLPGVFHAYIFAIHKNPGMPQEWIAKHLFFNKSTVARHLSQLENAGYIYRESSPTDKRELLVYPTDKMEKFYPEVVAITHKWYETITSDISEEEMLVFEKTLEKLLKSSIENIDSKGETK